MQHYRNRRYYKELLSIQNVKLLNTSINSHNILLNNGGNLMGIATINGTITFEALYSKIPVLLFGAETTPCGLLSFIISINSEKDLENMQDKLIKAKNNISNIELEKILNPLHFLMTKNDGFQISSKALETLIINAKYYL